MKKILGITFGGLQKKTIRLVLVMLLVVILLSTGVFLYQSRMLTRVVEETRLQQQDAISQSSQQTIYRVLESAQVNSTALQANLADNDFAEVVNNVTMLQTMAQGIFENRDSLAPLTVSPPDPALDGTVAGYALYEAGVDYRASKDLAIIAHLETPMIAMKQSSDKIDGCYIGLADGTDFCVDEKPLDKYDESGHLIPFPVRERPWYTGAAASDGIYFTGIAPDAFSGEMMVTCSAPVRVNGELVAVAGLDIAFSGMGDFIENAAAGSYAYIINDQGQILLGPNEGGPFPTGAADDLRASGNSELAAFIRQSLTETTALTVLTVDGKDYYMVGAPMPTVGWAVISAVEKTLTEQPAQQLLTEYERINQAASGEFRRGSSELRTVSLLMLVLVVIIGLVAALISTKRMVQPIEQMTRDIVHSSRTGELFEMKDSYRTNDEMELLAEAFDDLSKKTKRYIEQLTEITKEKERVRTELQLAEKIQESMLPSIFPAFPERPEFDIYASMDPAREVGGDFYDFFLIDDDHLCMVMADVSGKGVPAALFMMASKIILSNNAMMGKSPAKILEDTNTAICSNNRMELFVTVWLGILELSTGRLQAANAGHEYPVLKPPGGSFELYHDKHGFVVGGMDGVKYKDYELQLEPGAKLFLYTDGIPEATDENDALFGTERMLEALNAAKDDTPEAIMHAVRSAVDEFVRSAEQFDDLTMLCLEYRKKK